MLGRIRASDDDFDGSLDPGIHAISGAADTNSVTIPDAHLLFGGEYKRSGSFDLKIVGEDGKSVLIPDYFRSDKRATLQSPDGAALTSDIVEALSGPLAPSQYAQAAHAQAGAQVIGRVATVTGNATVLRNGVATTLNAGEAIQKGDVLQTGSGSKLGVAFVDGSTFVLNAGSRLVVSEMVYEAGGGNNRALFTLVDGATNFIAGQTAKTDLKVVTPAVTIGIRGTAVMLDISATDGRVSISVIDQRDNQIHQVDIFDSSGVQIGTAFSNGGSWTLTSTASLQVLAQQTGKTPQQIALEFAVLQELLAVYDGAQQYFPTPLPQHTDIDPSHVPVVSAIKVAGTQFLTTFPPFPGPLEVHAFFFNVEPLGGGNGGSTNTTGNTNPDDPPPPIDLPPVDFAAVRTVDLDEDGELALGGTLPGAVPDGPGDHPNAPMFYTGGPAADPSPFGDPQPLFDFGPDGPAAVAPIVFDTAALDALGLTSGGVALAWTQIGNTLVGVAGPANVIVLDVLDLLTGDFSIGIGQPLDHPAGENENEIAIDIFFTLTDGSGRQTTDTLRVRVDDDSPGWSAPSLPFVGFVEELPGGPQSIAGTLDIEWGLDNFNANTGTIDRSIAFTSVTPAANVAATDPDGKILAGLTSNGAALSYVILGPASQGAPVYLVAYTGAVPTATNDPDVVFWASLSDTGTGDWEFELRAPLDHPAPSSSLAEHAIDLTFSFTVTDSDGDPVNGTLVVRVDAADDIAPTFCGCGLEIDYSSLPEGVFINLADSTRTVAGEIAEANTAQDRFGVTTPVIGVDRLGDDVIDAIGTDSDDIIIGGAESNLLDGAGGADIIDGGRGADEIYGGGGDLQEIYGTDDPETFNVNRITLFGDSFVGINIRDGVDVVPATPGNSEVATRNVEVIFIDTGAGRDVVVITGSLGGTGLLTATITISGGTEPDTDIVDASGLTSNYGVIFDGEDGDDYFFSSAVFGNDTFDDCDGTDTIDFSFVCGCAGGIVIDLSDTGPQNTNYGLDTVIDVENVVGSGFDDTDSDVANTLTGRLGEDTLSGGTNADTFVFAELGAGNVDTVTDYSGVDGDTLDVSSLLDAAFVSGANVADFVRLQEFGSEIRVQLDTDGTGGPAGWEDVGHLSNYDTPGNEVHVYFEGNTLTVV